MDPVKSLLSTLGVMLVLGCGGDPAPVPVDAAVVADDAATTPDAAPEEDAATPVVPCDVTPTYTELRDTIFAPRCATGRCHGGTEGSGPARGPSNFTATSARTAMVDRASVYMRGFVLVRPGDPAGSFLLAKLTNDLDPNPLVSGVAMPPATTTTPWTMLPEDDIEAIRCWIAGGAP